MLESARGPITELRMGATSENITSLCGGYTLYFLFMNNLVGLLQVFLIHKTMDVKNDAAIMA